MKTQSLAFLLGALFLGLSPLLFGESRGVIREVDGKMARVVSEGDATPAPGDKAEIFFKLAGADDEISVASGTVRAVEDGVVVVQIGEATGDVAKDQLVRFVPGPGPRPAAAAAAPSQPAATTLPPSVPFPSVTPQSKPIAPPTDELNPAATEHVNRGVAQFSAGNIDGAIASYTSAIGIAPKLGTAYLNRANAYLYKPNFQAAIADATKAIELRVAKMDDAYTIRGTAKAGLGNYDSAIADCNRALKINPRHALAYNNRANNKLRKGDYKSALNDCNKSIALDASSALPFYNRGFVYVNTANPGGALGDWKKAVAMQPSFGAELNPKIAQLEARGVRAKSSGKSAPPDEPQWTDLTNAPQKIVGTWQGGRHRTQYFADGTFVTDPHLVPDPPRGRWQVEGDRLVEYFPQANMTTTHNILSIDAKTLILRNAEGQTFRKTKVGR